MRPSFFLHSRSRIYLPSHFKAMDVSQPAQQRQMAMCYVSSFLARAQYTSLQCVSFVAPSFAALILMASHIDVPTCYPSSTLGLSGEPWNR